MKKFWILAAAAFIAWPLSAADLNREAIAKMAATKIAEVRQMLTIRAASFTSANAPRYLHDAERELKKAENRMSSGGHSMALKHAKEAEEKLAKAQGVEK